MKLSKIDTFEKTVKLRIPMNEGNYEAQLKAKFKIMSASQAEKIIADLKGKYDTEEERNKAYLDLVLLEVSGIEDETSGGMLDGKAGRDAVKDYPFIMQELMQVFRDSLQDLRVKN